MRQEPYLMLYVVERDQAAQRVYMDDRPIGWAGKFLTLKPKKGDRINGRIRLFPREAEMFPGETTGPLSYRAAPTGDTEFDRIEGMCVLPQGSADCLCNALSWTSDPAVTTMEAAGDDPIEGAVIQQSRVGGGWRPLTEIRAETEKLTPDILALVPDALVVEARWNSHVMGGGESVAIVILEDAAHVLEWADTEDGPFHTLRPMAEHNREVRLSNKAWKEG